MRNSFFLCLLFVQMALPGVVPAETNPPSEAIPLAENPSEAQVEQGSPSTQAGAPAEIPAAAGSVPQAESTLSEQASETGVETQPEIAAGPSPFEAAVYEILPKGGKATVDLSSGERIFRKALIHGMYEANDWQPLWNTTAIQSLAEGLDGLVADGMSPDDYRFGTIAPYLDNPEMDSGHDAVTVDLLLTESYLRAIYNLRYGKVDPERLDADHNYATVRDGKNRAAQFLAWVKQGRIAAAFDWARPDDPGYEKLREALSHYRQLEEEAGWLAIPKGRRGIKPGATDRRISLVRSRLARTGDLALACETGPDVLDDNLQQALKRFQQRRGLKVDGVIGRTTLAALNVPVEALIDQIRANLERQRWYNRERPDEYLLVDIAAFKVNWIKNREIIWQELVQVGKRYTKTPIFQDQIEHIIFNPSWSVPPGIKRRTILPSLKADPSYLHKKGYQLIGANGKRVDPYSVDWYSLSRMPYTVRQPPGRRNALGKVKFMFPNKHSVFLHDTNHRDYFAKQVRLTSSGCIRLRNPFQLAEQLLGPQGWDKARIDKVLKSGRTTRVDLDKPLPIVIRYNTAVATEDGVAFRPDVYKRDKKIVAALDGAFRLHIPDLSVTAQASARARLRSASAAVRSRPRAEVIGIPRRPAPKPKKSWTAAANAPSFLDH